MRPWLFIKRWGLGFWNRFMKPASITNFENEASQCDGRLLVLSSTTAFMSMQTFASTWLSKIESWWN